LHYDDDMSIRIKVILTCWVLILFACFTLCLNSHVMPHKLGRYFPAEWSFGCVAYVQSTMLALFFFPLSGWVSNHRQRLALASVLVAVPALLMTVSAALSDISVLQWARVVLYQFEFALILLSVQGMRSMSPLLENLVCSILVFSTAGIPFLFYVLHEYGQGASENMLLVSPIGFTRALMKWQENQISILVTVLIIFAMAGTVFNVFEYRSRHITPRIKE